MAKKVIFAEVKEIDLDTIDSWSLGALVDKYGRNATFTSCQYYDDASLKLWIEREETDEEYSLRLEAEKQIRKSRKQNKLKEKVEKKKTEEKERKLYEQLKQKYGD